MKHDYLIVHIHKYYIRLEHVCQESPLLIVIGKLHNIPRKERERERERREREREREREIQTDRQTDGQTDREVESQRQR